MMHTTGMPFTAVGFTRSLSAFAIAACALGLGSANASAQTTTQTTTYTAPSGFFTVQVPAGWTTDWDKDLNQVTLHRGSAMATVQVLPLPHETSALATEMLETTRKELIGQCKGSDELQHGQAHIAGVPAQSFLLRCPNAPPSVAGTAIAWIEKNGQKILVQYTAIAQIRTYGDDVATLDAIGQSIHPTGLPAIAIHAPTEDERVDQVSRACRAGSFTQIVCAVRLANAHAGIASPPSVPASPAQASPVQASTAKANGGTRFHDADSVFSVEVPAGWQASLKDKNGLRGVELRQGDNWIALMIAPAASSPSDVVLGFEANFAKDGGPKPPLGRLGIIQLIGQGMEVDYDTFKSENDDGRPVDSMVAGIAHDSGSGQRVLMFSSISGDTDATGLKVARSIRLDH